MHSSTALLNLVLYFLPLHISICADYIRRMQNIYSKNLRCYFVWKIKQLGIKINIYY